MYAKEMILTGVSLSLLVYWELAIGEIPLGLFSISHVDQAMLFSGIILIKLLLSAVLISLGLRRLIGENRGVINSLLHHNHKTETAQKPACPPNTGTISARR